MKQFGSTAISQKRNNFTICADAVWSDAVIRLTRYGLLLLMFYTSMINRHTSFDSVVLMQDTVLIRGLPIDGDQSKAEKN